MQVLRGVCVYWDMEVHVLEIYGCYPFIFCKEVHMPILNYFSNFRYLFRELRSRKGLHLFWGFGTKKSLFKKPEMSDVGPIVLHSFE